MFSLDETSLAEGGEAILASKGDLGQLLFSASAGLSDLASRLDRIREETDQFHRPRAHKSDLADLKRRLDDLKAERDAIDIAASEYARLVGERDRARQAHEEANCRRAALRVRLETSAAHLSALPHLGRLGRLRDELAGMEVVPQAPTGWRQELVELARRQVELQTALGRLERATNEIDTEIDAAPPRDPMLDRAAEFESLQELAGRALSEERDLPNRMDERRTSERSIAAIIARLGEQEGGDPRRLLLAAKVLGDVRGLMAGHSGIEARLEAAVREEKDADHALADARAQWLRQTGDHASTDSDPHLLADLAEHLSALRAVDLGQREAAAQRDEEEALHLLERRTSQLRPWEGDAAALAGVVAPAQTVLTELGRRLTDAVETMRHTELECDGVKSELQALEAEYDAASGAPGIVTDRMAATMRDARERAWMEHRASLDAQSADRFHEALEADDRVSLQQLSHVSEITRLRGLEQSIMRLRARYAASDSGRAAAANIEALVRQQLGALIGETHAGLPRDMELIAFEAWCNRLAAAQEAGESLLRARRDLEALQRTIDSRRHGLRETLRGLGIDVDREDLAHLASAARRFLEGESQRAGLREAMRTRDAEFERRRVERADAQAARAAWQDAWHAALAGSWLATRDTVPSVAEMEEILRHLAALEGELERLDGLVDRIGKMERDIADFAGGIRGLAENLGLAAEMPPHALHRQLNEHLLAARTNEARLLDTRNRREGLAAERKDLLREGETLAARIHQMTGHYAVETLADVEAKIVHAEKREALQTEITHLSAEIAQSLTVSDLAELDTLLAAIDRDALAAEIETMKPEAEALDQETSRAYADLRSSERTLAGLGSDDEAARLSEARRTVLLEIEDGARRYLELRLGAIATDQALRLYRDRHQSSMMKKASEAFSQLSRGNYRTLATQRDGQREMLIAVGADGGSKEAKDLSKGTQFQLYLALRVAGYQEYATSRTPVPFVADDIMESFDEERSEEALTQLSIMAHSGQVIYLTHHRHICDIAQAVCPTATLHTL